jgi:membrane protein YqaA with SNARE-associated domain
MLRRMYDWTMEQAARPNALRVLGVVSFAESSFFPIPPDAMILPMVLARPDRAWRIALVASVTSVLGGIAGYAIGYYLLETIGQWVIDLYRMQNAFEQYRHWYAEYGLWLILIKGLTPIPYKLVTIASGAAAFDFWVFVGASIVTRSARFFLVAALLKFFGPPIRDFVERRLTLVTTAFLVILVGGFVAVKYLI